MKRIEKQQSKVEKEVCNRIMEWIKVEKEVCDHMMFLMEEIKKAHTEAFVHNNDRIVVVKEWELIHYCSTVEHMEGLSAEQIKLIKKIQQDSFRKIRGINKKEQREVEKFNRQIDEIRAASKPCFIATATMDNINHPKVTILREFRDVILLPTKLGNCFINYYYRMGPKIANIIQNRLFLRRLSYLFIVFPTSIIAKVMLLNRKRR